MSGGNRSVITKVQANGGVSGGAAARRPRAGGCARSRLCRRSGRNHSCSRSARSCTAARAGSALGTRLCLVVGVTGVDLARARAPEPHRPLRFWSRWVLQDPTSTAAPPPSLPSPGLALTDTACSGGVKLETTGTLAHCTAWPWYAATANAAALVRILLRAVLFCAGQENKDVTTNPSDGHNPASVPSRCVHLAGASPGAGGLHPRRNCSHSATSGTGTLGGAISGQCGRWTSTSTPLLPPANPFQSPAGSPAPRGGHGRHWAPQPRPWRQQQSSKVRVGPARGPAHMPSSSR